MSVDGGPKIVTDGLVMCLDATNPKSYPGSGVVWNDLSGNGTDATLLNNIPHSSQYFVLDGEGDGAIINDFPAIFSNSVTMSGWFYFDTDNTRDILFGSYDGPSNVNFERSSSNGLRIYWNYGENSIYSDAGIAPAVEWMHIAMCRNKEEGKFQFYVNGTLESNPNVTSSDINTTGMTFRIGRDVRTDSTNMNGKISTINIYSKALLPAEVKQNYNALKGRFGL